MIVFLIIFLSAISSGFRSCSSGGGTEVIISDVTTSTVEREKLADGLATFDEYYLDELDWIYDENELYSGMKTFYDETGVAPFLYLTDNIDGDYDPDEDTIETALNDFYDEHFDDEGHLLVLFMEDEDGYWQRYYIVGSAAKAVMDDEACEILMDFLDAYYYSDLEDEEYFSTVFEKTAERIMSITSSDSSDNSSSSSTVFVAVVIVVVVIVVVWMVVRYMRKRQRTQV
ncbi:MAG: hypothetical protein LUE29_01810 [Lachnospiraceae bacterium]|nr:hypothetical protein [Lachnospiraceae bacterium]